jgi:hypothetical protein
VNHYILRESFDNEWSQDQPAEPGWYWYYGYVGPGHKKTGKPEIKVVYARASMRNGARTTVFAIDGSFVKGEGLGKWKKLDLPIDLPDLSDLRELR